MAEDAVNEAVNHLRRIVPDSETETLAIIGAEGYSVLMNQIPRLAQSFGISEKTVEHLLNRYGSLIDEVLAPAQENKKLCEPITPNLNYIGAEIIYAVTHEGARSIDDVLSRRTRIAFEAKDQGLSVVEKVADLIAPHLNWKKAQKTASIKEYEELIERQNNILLAAKSNNSKVS
jgi:glycerol-3-phosphate dehydrogenase